MATCDMHAYVHMEDSKDSTAPCHLRLAWAWRCALVSAAFVVVLCGIVPEHTQSRVENLANIIQGTQHLPFRPGLRNSGLHPWSGSGGQWYRSQDVHWGITQQNGNLPRCQNGMKFDGVRCKASPDSFEDEMLNVWKESAKKQQESAKPQPEDGVTSDEDELLNAWKESAKSQSGKKAAKQESAKTEFANLDDNFGLEKIEASAKGDEEQALRDDSVLPDSLKDALQASAVASKDAFEGGMYKMTVEIFVPELMDPLSGPIMRNEGDQQRYWKMSLIFSKQLAEQTGLQLKVIFPDAGVAAMMKQQFKDTNIGVDSLNSRNPFNQAEDEFIVIANSDVPSIPSLRRISDQIEGMAPMVLFNPRSASGDVGVGLSVRRARKEFFDLFTTVYCLNPLFEDGSVTLFRKQPDDWKVFIPDVDTEEEGRYKMVSQWSERPSMQDIEIAIEEGEDQASGGKDDSLPGVANIVNGFITGSLKWAKEIGSLR